MVFLSEAEKQRIRGAVAAAEQQTSGEFVTVIAQQADRYLYIPTLWAAVLSLLTPALLMWLAPAMDYQLIYIVQLATFILLSALFRWQYLTLLLVPKTVKRQRASRLAWAQFFAQGLQNTQERNGVLLFVSVAEHYVEIIADKGINDRVEQSEWENIVNQLITNVRNKKIADGFVSAVNSCGNILQQHFPPQDKNKNELSDRLIEI